MKVVPNKVMGAQDALFILLLGQYSNLGTTNTWSWATHVFHNSSLRYFSLLMSSVESGKIYIEQ